MSTASAMWTWIRAAGTAGRAGPGGRQILCESPLDGGLPGFRKLAPEGAVEAEAVAGRGLASAAFPPGACSVARCPAALPPALEARGGPRASVLLLPVCPSTFTRVLCSLPGPRVGSSDSRWVAWVLGMQSPKAPTRAPWGEALPFLPGEELVVLFLPPVYLGTVWKFQI